MTGLTPRSRLSPAQFQGRAEVLLLARDHPAVLTFLSDEGVDKDQTQTLLIRLHTGALRRERRGLAVGSHEDIVVELPRQYPFVPPRFLLTHLRYAGTPNVVSGLHLCIYLDVSREWHPQSGMLGALTRLWDWFQDAAARRLNERNALYHPVGGVFHHTPGTPTVVVRDPLPGGRRLGRGSLRVRSELRYDLAWRLDENGDHDHEVAVVVLRHPLVLGAGSTFLGLLAAVGRPAEEELDGVARLLGGTARRADQGAPLYFLLAVPHRQPAAHHILVGRFAGADAERLFRVRPAVREPRRLLSVPIEWCTVSDERQEITMRRDTGRPAAALRGRSVVLIGCGGIGSWIGEFIARAGVTKLYLSDPGTISGGLLVRQNFTEDDIGQEKALALRQRLLSLRDDLDVQVLSDEHESEVLLGCDVVVDATASASVAFRIDMWAKGTPNHPLLAQVATDMRTGTQGVMSVVAAGTGVGPVSVDEEVRPKVLADGRMEDYHPLWTEPLPGDEIVPARGCSVPTFHGAAADLAAVAGCAVSLLAGHVGATGCGTHLFSLPHAPGGGQHHFINASPTPAAA